MLIAPSRTAAVPPVAGPRALEAAPPQDDPAAGEVPLPSAVRAGVYPAMDLRTHMPR